MLSSPCGSMTFVRNVNTRYPILPYASKFTVHMDNIISEKKNAKNKKRSVDVDVATDLLRYCEITRVRDPVLLEACADTFINNYSTILPSQLRWFLTPFGHLNYTPRSAHYDELAARCLERYFLLAPASDILASLLALTYRGRCPPHVAKLAFTRKFIEGLQEPGSQSWPLLLTHLKTLDDAMTLEFNARYPGPMLASVKKDRLPNMKIRRSLPKDDTRVRKLIAKTLEDLEKAANPGKRFTKQVKITRMPDESDVCMADLVMHPSDVKEATAASRIRNANVAVLINLPEHICINADVDTNETDQDILIGSEEMRRRHLRKLGFKVVCLDYDSMERLIYNPVRMNFYLRDKFEQAINCL